MILKFPTAWLTVVEDVTLELLVSVKAVAYQFEQEDPTPS